MPNTYVLANRPRVDIKHLRISEDGLLFYPFQTKSGHIIMGMLDSTTTVTVQIPTHTRRLRNPSCSACSLTAVCLSTPVA